MEEITNHDEYSQMVEIKEMDPPPVVEAPKAPSETKEKKSSKKEKQVTKVKKSSPAPAKKESSKKKLQKHLPKIEDGEGFDGRRPLVDPYVVGEKNVLELTYLGLAAGQLIFETLPFVTLNGKKAYKFKITMKSSDGFSMFYEIDNKATTFLDFDTLVPFGHEVHIKESKQIKETRSFFDWEKSKGFYWEKKVTKKGERSKKKEWDLKPYSQNLISSLFYIRAFTLKKGKEVNFNVTDAGDQNIITGTVIRQEEVEVPSGTYKTNVLQIQYKVDGTFKQIGDVFFYITDDHRKRLVKIQAKIKIGSIIGKSIELK